MDESIFLITTFSDDYKTLYRNDGNNNFSDVTYPAGLGTPTIPFLAWGAGFLDFDNDGLLDLFIANGHVYPSVDQRDWGKLGPNGRSFSAIWTGPKFQEVPPRPEVAWRMSFRHEGPRSGTCSTMATQTSS